jgi:hypothetical protein
VFKWENATGTDKNEPTTTFKEDKFEDIYEDEI